MKHQNPKPLKPSNAPPSSKVAVYDGIGIALVVLNYLLDDHPRHIRYRENQKQPQAPKPYRNHAPIRETIPPPPSRPRSPFIEIHPRPPSPPLRRRKSSFSRNDAPREHRPRQRRPEEFSTPFRPDTSPYYPVHPSRSEMHSAWSRIRAVTPTKRVRWGAVQTFEFDDGEEVRYVRRQDKPEKEVWGPVESGDLWGATRDYGIWGDVRG